MRSNIIDWLTSIADNYNLQMITIHYSATILDLFFSNLNNLIRNFTKYEYELYAITSLLIAAKSQEKDDKIPKSGSLAKHLSQHISWMEVN